MAGSGPKVGKGYKPLGAGGGGGLRSLPSSPAPSSGGGQANQQRVAQSEKERAARQTIPYSEKQLFRLATRLWKLNQEPGTDPGVKKRTERTLREALAGYGYGENVEQKLDLTGQKGLRISQKYGIPQSELVSMFKDVAPPYKNPSANPVGTALDYLSRPGQASMAYLAEISRQGEKHPTNIGPISWRFPLPWDADMGKAASEAQAGLEGKRADVTLGSIAQEAYKARAQQAKTDPEHAVANPNQLFGVLPGTNLRKGEVIPFAGQKGRIASDLTAAVMLDPTTWFSFGATAGAKGVVRSLAPLIADARNAEAAATVAEGTAGAIKGASNAGAVKTTVEQVEKELFKKGTRALSKSEKQLIRETFPKTRFFMNENKALHELAGAPGGIKIHGYSIPGTKVPEALGSLKADTMGRLLKRAEDEKPLSKALVAGERVTRTRGGIRQLERAGAVPVGTVDKIENLTAQYQAWRARADILANRATKAAEGLSDADLETIYKAMDVGGGGREAIAALPENLRPTALEFDKIRSEWQRAERELGLLPSPEDIANARAAEIDRAYRGKLDRARAAEARAKEARYRQSGRWANKEGARQGVAAEARTVQEDAAVANAVSREQALQERAVLEATGATRQATRAEAAAARREAVDATREAKAVEREVRKLEKMRPKNGGVDPLLEKQIAGAQDRWVEAQAKAEEATAKADRLAAVDEVAQTTRGRGFPVVPKPVNPDKVALPVGTAKKVVGAEKAATREATRLRVLENIAKSQAGRVDRLEAQRLNALQTMPRPIADEEYMARYLGPEGRLELNRTEPVPTQGTGQPMKGKLSSKRKARNADQRFTPTGEIVTKTEDPAQRFDTNSLRSIVRRGVESERDQARVRFTQGILDMKDSAGNPLVREMDDAIEKSIREGKSTYEEVVLPVARTSQDGADLGIQPTRLAVPKELKGDMERIIKVVSDDKEMQFFRDQLDKWMGLWKGYATVPGPFGAGFVMRNMEGNFFNGAVLAGTNPGAYRDAFRIQKTMWKGRREYGDPFYYLRETPGTSGKLTHEGQLAKDALDNHVLDSGFFENDIEWAHDYDMKPPKKGARKVLSRLNPVNQDNYLLHYGHKLNDAVEQNARFATYIGQTHKGMSAAEAGRVTRKYLFDYGDLSRVDKAIKRWSPFWTWTRKNTPLQIEMMAKQPGKYAALTHFYDALKRESQPIQTEYMPQWMIDSGGVVLPKDLNPNGDPSVLVSDLPIYSAADALKPLGDIKPLLRGDPGAQQQMLADLVNASGVGGPGPGGIAKLVAELGLGKQFFSGRQFQPGGQVVTPSYMNPFGLNPLASDKISETTQYGLEQLMPGLTKIRGLFPTDPKDQDAQSRRILSIFTGQPVYPLGTPTKRTEVLRRLHDLTDAQTAAKTEGYVLPDLPPSKRGKRPAGAKVGKGYKPLG